MATIIGLSGSNKIITSRSLVTEEIGIQKYTETFVTTTFGAGIGPTSISKEGAAIPAVYSQSTRYPFMNVENFSIKEMEGELAEVTVNYIGFSYPILFSWPPTIQPTISSAGSIPSSQSSLPSFGAATSKTNAKVRCFPSGQEGSDWLFYPLIVEINFIDSVENEYKMISSWKVGTTPMPSSFRGMQIPPSTRPPFRESPPNPIPEGYSASLLTYLGPCLSGLNISRRGNRYNQINATFRDTFFYTEYNQG